MVYQRTMDGQTCIIALNPSGKTVKASLPHIAATQPTDNTALEQGSQKHGTAGPTTLLVTGKATYKSGKQDVVTLGPVAAAIFLLK